MEAGVKLCAEKVGQGGQNVQTGGGRIHNDGIHILQTAAPDDQAGVDK